MPGAYAVSSALNEYHSLKALGEDGLAHLTAFKTDLLGQSSASGGSVSSGTLSGSGTSALGSSTLAEIQALLATPGPDVINPAYTYLAQRQGGTYYPLQVTVNPAKGVSAEGTKPTTWKTTVSDNTFFALGGKPLPPPPAATATPTATATPAATATSGSGSASAGGLSSKIPDQAHITLARQDLLAAQRDFIALGVRLAHPDWVLSLAAVIPCRLHGPVLCSRALTGGR